MDSKSTEKKIISLVAENFGVAKGEYWGYITSGGTESNFWGIREGFNRFQKGKLYFSEDTHYSVEKYVFDGENCERYPYEKIAVDKYGRISAEKLFEVVERDRKNGVNGAIVVLTWGTTCRGAIDEVKRITDGLRERGIEYYCHLDAAHFGGIAKNQKNAPYVEGLCELGVDSVAVSMHKFMGTARVNGVLLALTRRDRPVIDYIGQEDSTLLGSRDYLPFSTYQRAREMLLRREPEHFCENVLYFDGKLREARVAFERFGLSNTFIIAKPSDAICKKYQLATFVDSDGAEKAHIIIFPFHRKEIMDELVEDIMRQ
jgi:histidine decarboxylase